MKKKLLAGFLAAALALSSTSVLPRGFMGLDSTIEANAEITSGNYEYQVVGDGKAELLRYIGNEENVVVPATIDGYPVRRLFSSLFWDNDTVKSVTVSEGIEMIDGNVIDNCKNLTSLTLPASVKSIGHCIEQGTTSLTTIKVSASSEYFTASNNVLYSKDKTILYLLPAGTESFTVPSTVKTIWSYAMYGQTLKSIQLNEGLETIGEFAFSECSSLTSVKLPSTLKTLNSGAFYNCQNLKSVSLPDSLKTIESYCFFEDAELTSVKLPEGLSSLGERAYAGCTKMTGIDMPASVGTIGRYAVGFADTYGTPKQIPNFKYRCYYATEGQNYASSHDLPYELIDPERIDEDKRKFENGEVLSFNRIKKDHFWSSARKGFYYAGDQNDDSPLIFQSFETGTTETVRDFKVKSCNIDLAEYVRNSLSLSADTYIRFYDSENKLFSAFCQGNKLYLGYRYEAYYYSGGKYNSYYIYVLYKYDTDSNELLNTSFLGIEKLNYMGTDYDALGVDGKGRIYVAHSIHTDDDDDETDAEDETKHYIDMYSPAMKKLATAEVPTKVYSFGGFDDNSGIFSLIVYYNWIYWGYPHAMSAVILGKAGSDSLEISNRLVCTIGQLGYSNIDSPVRLIGDYICIDSPLSITGNLFNPSESGMNVFDLSQLYVSDENCFKMDLRRNYYSAPGSDYLSYEGSKYARVCAVPGGKSNHIIAVEGESKIAEYDPEKGTESAEIGFITVDHPVYELFSDSDHLYIVMRDKDNEGIFYLQRLKWSDTSKLTISNTALTVKVGDRKQLTTSTDGTFKQKVTWSSDDPTIASVSETGAVTAMKAGKAVITAVTDSGMKASCIMTITDSALAEVPGEIARSSAGAKSSNKNDNYYGGLWSSTVNSYLFENKDKTLTRAEFIDGKVVTETRSADGKTVISTKSITAELPIFGGIFVGKDFNFIVFGQKNPNYDDNVEVVRAVKYSKSWEKLGTASIKGANTYIPFDAGSLRMTESDGRLYIHTCHKMYADEDGLNHQANMTFCINESSLEIEQQQYEVYNYTTGYVSHSFNQFIKADGNRIYRLDHGDSSPRGFFLDFFLSGNDPREITGRTIASFGSSSGHYNYTGANLGGFEITTNNVVTVYSSIDQENSTSSKQYNIYLSILGKDLINPAKTVMLTEYKEDSNVTVGAPQIVKLNEETLLVMWQETRGSSSVTKFVTVNESGIKTSNIVSQKTAVSDCQPILCSDGLVRWYVTNNSAPVFYSLNLFYLNNFGRYEIGDVNKDGAINMKDLADLQRYVNGWDIDIDIKTADMNNDGKINMKDIAALQRLINSL